MFPRMQCFIPYIVLLFIMPNTNNKMHDKNTTGNLFCEKLRCTYMFICSTKEAIHPCVVSLREFVILTIIFITWIWMLRVQI